MRLSEYARTPFGKFNCKKVSYATWCAPVSVSGERFLPLATVKASFRVLHIEIHIPRYQCVFPLRSGCHRDGAFGGSRRVKAEVSFDVTTEGAPRELVPQDCKVGKDSRGLASHALQE